MLRVSVGDQGTFQLRAKTGVASYLDLTGASFETRVPKLGGGYFSLPDGAHTADPDQSANKGKYTVDFTSIDSSVWRPGSCQEIVTIVTQGGAVTAFHGRKLLTVLKAEPSDN